MKLSSFISLLRTSSVECGNKSWWKQLAEIISLFLVSRLGPGFYYQARMDQQGVSFREVLSYASVSAYNRAVHRANDKTYYRASQHKAIEKAVLHTYGIPSPELQVYADFRRGRTIEGRPATSPEAVVGALAPLKPGTKLCFKQAHGWGGEGFRAATLNDSRTLTDSSTGSLHTIRDYIEALFKNSPEGFVIEKYVEQHPFYASLNPTSVNSFRILIHDRAGGDRPWLFAFLRVGRDGALVDNASSGAIILPVAPDTLELEAGLGKYGARVRYEVHPDTGASMAGIKPPDFEAAVELALDAVRIFPGITFAGVDVAMSVNGPVVLEINVWPDYSGFAHCRVPSKPAFVGRV